MKNIIVKNQYSLPDQSGKGSRGSSPKAYIHNYMSRATATASVDNYVENYMRVNKASGERKGVAFTKNTLIANEDEIKRASNNIETRFKQGYPFMKTVVSFDTDYLIQTGVVPQGFKPKNKGDFIGNVDESKIRLAVKKACDNLAKNFGDLEYVGCIHLDTKHVHVHLCMSDLEGERTYQKGTKVGEKHGKLNRKELDIFKLRVSDVLSNDRYKMLHLQDVITAKHKLEFDALSDELIDFDKLGGLLPSNKGLWRYDSNATSMSDAKKYINSVFNDYYEKSLKKALKPLAKIESINTSKKETDILDDLLTAHRRRFCNSVLQKQKKKSNKKTADRLVSINKNKVHNASIISNVITSTTKAINDVETLPQNDKDLFLDSLQSLTQYPDVFILNSSELPVSILSDSKIITYRNSFKTIQSDLMNIGYDASILQAVEYINSKLDQLEITANNQTQTDETSTTNPSKSTDDELDV